MIVGLGEWELKFNQEQERKVTEKVLLDVVPPAGTLYAHNLKELLSNIL